MAADWTDEARELYCVAHACVDPQEAIWAIRKALQRAHDAGAEMMRRVCDKIANDHRTTMAELCGEAIKREDSKTLIKFYEGAEETANDIQEEIRSLPLPNKGSSNDG